MRKKQALLWADITPDLDSALTQAQRESAIKITVQDLGLGARSFLSQT